MNVLHFQEISIPIQQQMLRKPDSDALLFGKYRQNLRHLQSFQQNSSGTKHMLKTNWLKLQKSLWNPRYFPYLCRRNENCYPQYEKSIAIRLGSPQNRAGGRIRLLGFTSPQSTARRGYFLSAYKSKYRHYPDFRRRGRSGLFPASSPSVARPPSTAAQNCISAVFLTNTAWKYSVHRSKPSWLRKTATCLSRNLTKSI